MFKKESRLFGILHNKCPRCHEGHFFNSDHPYKLKTFDKMEKRCCVCDLNYEPEPGYYYGAMYVSYALNVAVFVTLWIMIEVLKTSEISLTSYILLLVVPNLLLTPVIYRLSRLTWISFFTKYNKTILQSDRVKIQPGNKADPQ